jgi:hypothetical protein
MRANFLAAILFAAPLGSGCSHQASPNDACGLLTKADVEKVLGAPVHEPLVETVRSMSISRGRTMETLAGCIYTLDPSDDKPARAAIHIYWFREPLMMNVHWQSANAEFAHSQRIPNLGEEAWQGQGIKVRKGDVELLIEVDDLVPNPPPHSNSSTLPTRLYPEFEVALARLATNRL